MTTNRTFLLMIGLAAALAVAGCRIVPVDETGPAAWTHGYLVKPAPGSPAVLYLWITNPAGRADTVTGVRVAGADSAQVHKTVSMGNGMERMVPAGPLPVDAHDTVKFQPGGLHIMVFGLRPDLAVGDSAAVTVTFREAGDVSGFAHVITYAQVDSAVGP